MRTNNKQDGSSGEAPRSAEHAHQPIRAGALTLLMLVVSICLAIFSVLALSTARADRALAQKQQAYATLQADEESAGQQWLMQVDTALLGVWDGLTAANAAERLSGKLPEGTVVGADGRISATLQVGEERSLTVAVRIAPLSTDARYSIVQWQIGAEWEPEGGIQLWSGN